MLENKDNIVDYFSGVVLDKIAVGFETGKKTARFDNSYFATILGVNRKFANNVTEDDINNELSKFNIPEIVNDGEDNYYTFKINGVYYCKPQNSDFKLYDKVMVYIPNGNWDNLYLDHAVDAQGSSANNDSNVRIPRVIEAVDPPGGTADNNNLWIEVVDKVPFTDMTENEYYKMYCYTSDEDSEDSVQRWQLANVAISKESPDDGTVGMYWIKTDNDGAFTEIDICTSASGSTYTWSRVYPDSEIGSTPALTIDLEPPIQEGDYWIQIDSEGNRNLVAFYRYEYIPETNRMDWRLVYKASVPMLFSQPEDPSLTYTMKDGYYWIEIDNITDKHFVSARQWENNTWKLLCTASEGGGGGDVYINISHAILVQQEDIV